jgi:hypothetical protein
MREKLRAHFLRFGPRRFVFVTVFLLIVTDLLNCWYLSLYWQKKNFSDLFVDHVISQSGLMAHDFQSETILEMHSFINNTFYFFLTIIIANNLFFYFFYLRKRLWAQGFVLFYTLTAGLLAVTLIFDNAGLGSHWLMYNTASMFMYIYLYFGVKVLKPETTLERGKKGR